MYPATYIIDIAALLFLIWFLYSSTAVNIFRKKPFLVGVILVVIAILSEAGTIYAAYDRLNLRGMNILCNVLGFSLTPLIPIAITWIFDTKILKQKLWLLPSLVNIAATVLSPWYGYIFYVDTLNHYFRGDYYYIFIVVYIINFWILVINTLEVGKRFNYPITVKLFGLFLFTVIGTSIQLVYPSSYSTFHCVTLSLILYFLLISEFDSSFDPLTGLYNRAAFENATKRLGETKAFSVIAIDINDFKNVNDTYGHYYGDTVIRAVAEVIREAFDQNYSCYRLGGDEFFIIGKETDQEKLEEQLRIMTRNLANMRAEGIPLPTVSYGYSIFREGKDMDFYQTFKEADEQMYHYKKIHKADAAGGKGSALY